MSFTTYFRLTSYATIAAAALALFVAHGVGAWLAIAFALVTIAAWKLEGTRWQLSERIALAVILLSLPLFYVDWRILVPYLEIEFLENGQRAGVEVTVLGHLILFLSAVKLLQCKADRDWFFLYLISFFVVLLAAGLSTKPVFLLTLALYLLCVLSTVVAFEIQKARRKVQATQTRILIAPDSTIFRKLSLQRWRRRYHETRRLPYVSVGLLLFIVALALPFFLIAPRTRANALTRSGNGLAGMFVGFSDRVRLGDIGRLKTSDEIVMHVRLETNGARLSKDLRWRGVALDQFTGREWIKSPAAQRFEKKESDSGLFQVGTTEDLRRLTAQTFFVEPLDTPVLFGLPRIVALQGRLPFVRVDSEGSIQSRSHDQDRAVYKVYSDTVTPDPSMLEGDPLNYYVSAARYLSLPDNLDPRIRATTRDVLARWTYVIEQLADDPMQLNREVDWVIKQQLIQAYMEKNRLSWRDPKVSLMDLQYHDIRPDKGLYFSLVRRDLVDRITDDESIERAKHVPPQTTRARLRGEFIRQANLKGKDYRVDWVYLKLNDPERETILCKDPFQSHDERVERLIRSF